MLQSLFVVVAVAFLATIAADDIPEKCKTFPKKVHPHDCCEVPPVFSQEIMEKCGFPKAGSPRPPPPSGPPTGPPPCDKELCIFREMNIMTDDENVDATATATAIRDWIGEDENWGELVEDLTNNCLEDLTEGPPGLCQPIKVLGCIRGSMFHNCPESRWNNSADCNALREFMTECPHPHKPNKQ